MTTQRAHSEVRTLGRPAIDAILRRLRTVPADDAVLLDMRGIGFLRPAHLVGIAARAYAAHRDGLQFQLLAPAATNTASYAARMRLGQVLSELAAGHDVPESSAERDRTADLLELSVIRDHADVRRLTELVHRKVRAIDRQLANALYEALAEVGGNVSDHARDIGFTVAQTMPGLRELRFAVADAGVGLRATLEGRGAVDDATAIGLALDGVSRFDNPARGNGVKRTVDLVAQLGGWVYVASGSVSVRASTAGRRQDDSDYAFQGTLVEATIPLPGESV